MTKKWSRVVAGGKKMLVRQMATTITIGYSRGLLSKKDNLVDDKTMNSYKKKK